MKNIKYWNGEGFPNEPSDNTVEITEQEYCELMNANSHGKQIVSDKDGYPILLDPKPLTQQEQDRAEIQRLQTLLKESDYAWTKCGEEGLVFADTYPELKANRIAWRARINELQTAN